MGWGHAKEPNRTSYAELEEQLDRARDKSAGKPLEYMTRAFRRSDTMIALHHYNTDILCFYADGTIKIKTSHTSDVTMARIRGYANATIWTHHFTAVDGHKHSIDKTYAIRCSSGKWYPFKSVDGYITIDKHGVIDESTIKPLVATAVADPKAVRAARRTAVVLKKHIELRMKLGQKFDRYCSSEVWLKYNLGKPLDEIDWQRAPMDLDIEHSPIHYAKMIGMTKELIIKEVPCPRWS